MLMMYILRVNEMLNSYKDNGNITMFIIKAPRLCNQNILRSNSFKCG